MPLSNRINPFIRLQMYRSPMTTPNAPTCEPSREMRALLEVLGDVSAAWLLHALGRREAATAADLAARMGAERAVVESGLSSLAAVGLVDRAGRAPLPQSGRFNTSACNGSA